MPTLIGLWRGMPEKSNDLFKPNSVPGSHPLIDAGEKGPKVCAVPSPFRTGHGGAAQGRTPIGQGLCICTPMVSCLGFRLQGGLVVELRLKMAL